MGSTRKRSSASHKLSLAALFTALSRPALAAPPGDSGPDDAAPEPIRFAKAGRWVIGLEGVIALAHQPGAEETYTVVDESGRSVELTTRQDMSVVSTLAPAIGIDAFVLDHLSVGFTAHYQQATFAQETSSPAGESTRVSSTSRVLRTAPRVGVAYTTDSGFGIWPRARLTLDQWWSDTPAAPGGLSRRTLHVMAEGLATFAPRPDIVLTAGPFVAKEVASGGDMQAIGERGDPPPELGLTFGAGLVL